ncbi:signal peptidase II [Rhizobium sp. KVB221]|uniref:Lipoprotein signal peptidase n=1 Tax=Rhizobium setariae TaxID=2801340 RepID=A0A937CLM6_9HYPH|nr:signal peptidase II [Rhizobium setariae]MBL0371826.1 signal peptidase II [Rhizobium setariae]
MAEKTALFSRPPVAALFIVIAVILDQLIKYLVEAYLPFQQLVEVIPHLGLYRTWNEGVAFSFLSGMSGWMIVAMRVLIVIFVFWWWKGANRQAGLIHLGFCMIIAGAIGNIVDRFIYGHVVDYVLFYTETWSFAVFNLADSLITLGATAVGIHEIFFNRKAEETAR